MIHNNVKQDISELMVRLTFSSHAATKLLSDLDKILENTESAKELDALLCIYDETEFCDYADMLTRINAATENLGIHEYTASMLLFLALGERLKERYIERGLKLDLFYASLVDLKYKLEECQLVYGIVGTFVASWFQEFYQLRRFALGRLQFGIIKTNCDVTVEEVHITKDTKVIDIHIPRTGGPFNHDDVVKSYALAADFFRSEFDDKIIFHCNTWLFDPFNRTVLSPNSNIVKFMDDFTITKTGVLRDYDEAWRLFDKNYNGNPDDLPGDTSLRRAYIERIRRGEPLGWGRGFFIYH